MTFSEFGSILYKLSGGLKHEFVRDLLKLGLNADGACTVDEEIPDNEGGKDRLRKYLSDRDISKFAINIINSFEKELFLDRIEEFYDESDIPAICEAFESHAISIDPDDLPQQLCEIYQDILMKAAKGEHSSPTVPNNVKKEINEMITELSPLIVKLLSLGNQIELWGRGHLTTKYTDHPKWKLFQDSYQRYLTLNTELQNYFKIYSCELFKDAVSNSKEYTYMSFMWCKDKEWSQKTHDKIENYRQTLLRISSELE